MRPTLCIGHRGAKGYVPENTLPSFEYAIQLGCPWVELDVYVVENELVVIHDRTVDRTTNGSGPVTGFTLEALQRLDAGNGARIPTLKEVLELIDHRAAINIELKAPGSAALASSLLSSACENDWQPTDFLISSFSHPELALMDPRFPRGALFAKRLPDQWERAQALGAWSVNFELKDVDAALVKEAHQRGYRILVYTVNEESDLERMLTLGVDGMFCDFPDRMLRLL